MRRTASILVTLVCVSAACGPCAVPSAPTAAPTPAAVAQAATPAPPNPVPAAATQATGVAAAGPTVTPKRGGTLVIAASADPDQFNPGISTAGGTHFVADNIYNGLVFLDAQLNPQPDLADSWEVSQDGKTYTFHLHPGVKWQQRVLASSHAYSARQPAENTNGASSTSPTRPSLRVV